MCPRLNVQRFLRRRRGIQSDPVRLQFLLQLTLDNILRLAKNGSGLSAIVVKDVPLKSFVDLLRFRFEKPNHSFPVSVQSRLEEGVIEEVSIALDVSVLEWSVESLLLNAKSMLSRPKVQLYPLQLSIPLILRCLCLTLAQVLTLRIG